MVLEKEMYIEFKKLSETATIPSRGSDGAAGYDLYADIPRVYQIAPHATVKVPTNIAMAIPSEHFGAVYARSGLATKKGLRPAQGTAVIDKDYRGNIFVPLYNQSDESQEIQPGERIAQIIFQKYENAIFVENNSLGETKRGEGGFGSTGST